VGKWIKTNPDKAPLFAHGSLWRFIEGGVKSNYGIKKGISVHRLPRALCERGATAELHCIQKASDKLYILSGII